MRGTDWINCILTKTIINWLFFRWCNLFLDYFIVSWQCSVYVHRIWVSIMSRLMWLLLFWRNCHAGMRQSPKDKLRYFPWDRFSVSLSSVQNVNDKDVARSVSWNCKQMVMFIRSWKIKLGNSPKCLFTLEVGNLRSLFLPTLSPPDSWRWFCLSFSPLFLELGDLFITLLRKYKGTWTKWAKDKLDDLQTFGGGKVRFFISRTISPDTWIGGN